MKQAKDKYTSGKPHVVLSPYSGEKVGEVTLSTVEDVEQAVRNSYDVFHSVARHLSPYERYEILFNACNRLQEKKEEIAHQITHESGKILRESRLEVDRAVLAMQFSAEESKRISGQILPCDIASNKSGKNAYVHRKPIGVIAAITPFNFPLNTVIHKIAPAIASGNTVVLKPSLKTPLTAEILLELFYHCGCPPDMLSLVQGDVEVGEALVKSNLVRMVSFTGSVPVGHRIAQIAGMKKLTLELGGNDPLIVFKDGDLPSAVATAIEQGLGTCGQRCTAVKRVFVQKEILSAFMDILISKVKELKVGDPYDPTTDIGPMISESAACSIEEIVNDARKNGARLLLGGRRQGALLEPIIMDQVPPESRLVNEETFGPVLPVMSFDTVEEVISKVNSTPYGLQAGVYTNQMEIVKRLFHDLEVGTLIVNGGPGFRIESIPFGGVKESGLGREGIIAAIQEMTETSTLVW